MKTSENAALDREQETEMPEIYAKQEEAAQNAFDRYDFGDGVQILDHKRWQADESNGQDDWTKVAYAQFHDDPGDAPSHRLSFHVRFDKGTDRLVGAYAYLGDNGEEIGFLPGKL